MKHDIAVKFKSITTVWFPSSAKDLANKQLILGLSHSGEAHSQMVLLHRCDQ